MPVADDGPAMKVEISADAAQAELIIPADYPSDHLTEEICHIALREVGVELTDKVIQATAALVSSSADQAGEIRQVVAEAAPVEHGQAGRVEWLVDAEQEDPQQQPEAEAEADPDRDSYYEKSAYMMVKRDQKIGRIIEPTPGTDGRDVRGRTIAAIEGKPVRLNFDESIMRSGANDLYAQEEGVLVRDGDSAMIRQVLAIKGYVDFSTGNIDFNGDVIVDKGVRDCFIVKSGGNVEVAGLIEAATIECVGDLVARGGFAGREKGTAHIGGNLVAKYLDNINGTIKGDLCVDKEVINCEFEITGAVRSPHGSFIGGRHVVAGEIDVGTIGSPACVPTELVVGTVPGLDVFAEKLEPFVEKYLEQRDALTAENQALEQNAKRLTAGDKERHTEIIFELLQIEGHLKKASNVFGAITDKIKEQQTVDIRIASMLHAGTILNFSGRVFQVHTDLRGPVRIHLNRVAEPIYTKDSGSSALTQVASSQAGAAA